MNYTQYAKLLGAIELAYRIGLSDGINKKSTSGASTAKGTLDQILYEDRMHPDLDPKTLYSLKPQTLIFEDCYSKILEDIHRFVYEEGGKEVQLYSYDGINWFKVKFKNDNEAIIIDRTAIAHSNSGSDNSSPD